MRLPLHVNLRPSAALQLTLAVGHLAAAAALLSTALPWWLKVLGETVLVASLGWTLARHRNRYPRSIAFHGDGRIELESADGGLTEMRLQRDTQILPWVVVLAMRAQEGLRLVPIPADALDWEANRRLRLWLRFPPSD